MKKFGEIVRKIAYSWITTLVLSIIMMGLLAYLMWDVNPIERTISMAGYNKRIVFFFWAFLIDLLFLINIKKANYISGFNLKIVNIVVWIGFAFFIMTGVHDWVDVGKSVKGILLHSVPAILFTACVFVCLFSLSYVYAKRYQSRNMKIWWICFLVILVIGTVCMAVFSTSALPEMIPFFIMYIFVLLFNYVFIPKRQKQIDDN